MEWSHITGREVAAEWSEVMWQTNTHATRLLRRLLFAVPTDTTTAHTRPERTRTQHTAADRSFWRVCGVGVPASPIPLLAWGDAGDRRCSCSPPVPRQRPSWAACSGRTTGRGAGA